MNKIKSFGCIFTIRKVHGGKSKFYQVKLKISLLFFNHTKMTNEFQEKVKKFMDKNNMNNPIENRMLDLVDEIGEVCKEINKMSSYGTKEPEFREEIIMELGDAFYSLITVANYYDIDLSNALNIAIEKYEKRIKKWWHAWSEND